ncbi:hypothetical protein ABBQ38_002264 [Trebouxia sp. C0009 RCD-2024]
MNECETHVRVSPGFGQPRQTLQHPFSSKPPSKMYQRQSDEQPSKHQQPANVWQQADFDAIAVPASFNLPQEEVQRIQRSFLGKPVMQHGGSVEQETEQLCRHGYKSWKEYLLTGAYDRESMELGYQVFTDSDDES